MRRLASQGGSPWPRPSARSLLPASAFGVAQIHEQSDALRDYDARSGAIAPTSAQRAAVKRLGAKATWNQFGTPATLSKRGKYLAKEHPREERRATRPAGGSTRTGRSSGSRPPRASSSSATRGSSSSRGHAVHFRQVFGGLETVDGGLITVGLTRPGKKGWSVAFVSSSLTADTALDGRARLSPPRASRRLRAAPALVLGRAGAGRQAGRRRLDAAPRPGLRVGPARPPRRLPDRPLGRRPGVRVTGRGKGDAAYRVVVDARNGALLARQSTVHNAAETASSALVQT